MKIENLEQARQLGAKHGMITNLLRCLDGNINSIKLFNKDGAELFNSLKSSLSPAIIEEVSETTINFLNSELDYIKSQISEL